MIERQLAFDLPAGSSFAREDFLVADSNRGAWTLIESWPDWPDHVVALVGPPGSGKSHLASIWAERVGARRIASGAAAPPFDKDLWPACALIDDADRAGMPETDLFHLLNQVRSGRRWLVLTARTPPDQWGLKTPDLVSRLRLAPSVRLDEPGEDLMQAVLSKLFVDRQLGVDRATIAYLALRLERSFEAARRIVEILDRDALALSRPITRPLVAAALARLRESGGGAADGFEDRSSW